MAVIVAQGEPDAEASRLASFEGVWSHYLRTGFLYPGKLDRIRPIVDDIRSRWDRLVAAPEQVFQLHVALRAGEIASSHSLVRDTDRGFMIQHAASDDNPLGMLACAMSILRKLDVLPRDCYACMYFRPEHEWTTRFVDIVNRTLPRELTSMRTREYLVARPADWASARRSEAEAGLVEQVDSADASAVQSLLTRTSCPLNRGYDGLDGLAVGMPKARAAFEAARLVRERRMFIARHDGQVAGVALRYHGDKLNLSLLCHRVELYVPEQAPDRTDTVRRLAVAAIADAAADGDAIISLLVDSDDANAAEAAGFSRTGRRYSHAVWGLESGTSAGYDALAAVYAHHGVTPYG